MEEGSGTRVADSSGHGHDQYLVSTPANPAWSTDVSPLVGGNSYSLAFDGVDDYTYAWDVREMVSANQLTLEAWVKFSGLGNYQGLFAAAIGGAATQWVFGVTPGRELYADI
jgi:hypothetical protein